VFIDNVTVTEGDADPTNAVFQVRLSAPSGLAVSMSFATTNGSATSGLDYQATNGLLTFSPGQTNLSLAIPVWGDQLSESNETFSVWLRDLTNAVTGDLMGLVTVQDNDPLPSLSVQAPIPINEPAGGTTNLAFAVSLSPASGRTVTVKYATSNGSATAGADFIARSGVLLFSPGTTTQMVDVAIRADTLAEAPETFSLTLSIPVNATLGGASAAGQILDAGASPFLGASYPTGPFLEAILRDGSLWIRFETVRGDRYTLEWTEAQDLGAGRWKTVEGAPEILGTGHAMELADPSASTRPSAFYRVRRLR
jgi:hypothetical protein